MILSWDSDLVSENDTNLFGSVIEWSKKIKILKQGFLLVTISVIKRIGNAFSRYWRLNESKRSL
ncbi:MAG: hypothetical protein CL885_00365 [Dehalococcoidia bacterium]|nr:hypothetical protein [Dehalococcoidia bacterium]